MKKEKRIKEDAADMRAEYDFSGGVRGKHYKALQQGHTIRIHKADGTIEERHVPGKRIVVLEPDVHEYFPTSQAVNEALRTLISIVPAKRKVIARKKRGRKTAAGSRVSKKR